MSSDTGTHSQSSSLDPSEPRCLHWVILPICLPLACTASMAAQTPALERGRDSLWKICREPDPLVHLGNVSQRLHRKFCLKSNLTFLLLQPCPAPSSHLSQPLLLQMKLSSQAVNSQAPKTKTKVSPRPQCSLHTLPAPCPSYHRNPQGIGAFIPK